MHTPGPWKLEEILIGDYNPDSEKPDSRPVSHCVVAAYDENLLITGALPNTSASSELMANAALIAAAPEMLGACKKALICVSGKDVEHVWMNYPVEPCVTLGDILRAAISAADGGK